jgi:hypothetical protein
MLKEMYMSQNGSKISLLTIELAITVFLFMLSIFVIEITLQFRLLKSSYNKSQPDALVLNLILVKNSACFGQICCPSSGVSTLYTQQQAFIMLVMLTVC